MSDNDPSQDAQARFKELVSNFKPKLSHKFALLMPFKEQIEELVKRRAAYDDIRLILSKVKIVVSNDTVHRFCRQVIGQKVIRAVSALIQPSSSANSICARHES